VEAQEEEEEIQLTDEIAEFSLVFDVEQIADTLSLLRHDVDEVKRLDSERGIYHIGVTLIGDSSTRSE
jgi:hypothetical protein